MEISVFRQTSVFLWSFLIGGVLAAIYTVIAVIREISPPGRVLLFVTDFLFMFTAAMINFAFALSQTNGRIRGYSLFAQAAAFFLLYFTVGAFVKRSAGAIRSFVLRLSEAVLRPALSLYGRIYAFAASKCRKLLKKTKKM